MSRKKDLKGAIEDELRTMLGKTEEPNEQRMKLLKLGIGYLAVQAKLEESEYGGYFNEGTGDEGSDPTPRKEPRTRKHESNERADPAGDDQPGFFADEIAGRIPS